MRVLDAFCGAGGTSMGFHRAGFEVFGVDINNQKRYPFDFWQGDAIEFILHHGHEFDLICAGPPCQKYSKAAKQWRLNGKQYPDLIAKTRQALTGLPYVIENVPNAPLINPIYLNGSFFNLLVHRPRFFECSFLIEQPDIPQTKKPVKMGRMAREGDIIQPVGHFTGVEYARKQMQIDWMVRDELSQAIPPAYTEWIGRQYLAITT